MGSRKNPNRRNARLQHLLNAFRGYTKEVRRQQEVDRLATGEFVSLPQIIAAMSRSRQTNRSLRDVYYEKAFYDPIRAVAPGVGYSACSENHTYRDHHGREDREAQKHESTYIRAGKYTDGMRRRVAEFFSVENTTPRKWLKDLRPAVESMYTYVSIGAIGSRMQFYETDASVDIYVPPPDVYRAVERKDPRYAVHVSDEDGYQVLVVREALPRGRFKAAALQMVGGMPHLCVGYIYQYKKEWRFQPQHYQSLLGTIGSDLELR